jgi:GNAT superfamily N-acetyltransferase
MAIIEPPAGPRPARHADARATGSTLVCLLGGTTVSVGPVRPHDERALRRFLGELCPEARRLRFFSGAVDVPGAARWAADPLTGGRHGLVARDATGAVVGHAVYMQLDPTSAEVAVEVADHLHGRGLATRLIERLAIMAEARGIVLFVAEVLCENRAMLDVFREGFDARVVHRFDSEAHVEFLTSGWRIADERFAGARERDLLVSAARG